MTDLSQLREFLRVPPFRSKSHWVRLIRQEGAGLLNSLREAEACHSSALLEIRGALQSRLGTIQSRAQQELAEARTDFQRKVRSTSDTLRQVEEKCGRSAAPWLHAVWDTPVDARTPIPRLTRVGTLSLGEEGGGLRVPALIPVIGGRSVIFEGPTASLTPGIDAASSLVLRLLSCMPPGNVRLLLIDPSGLGRNVAGFLHLGDYSRQLVTSQAWYQPNDIEKRLEEVSAHIAAVTQRSLRSKYKTI